MSKYFSFQFIIGALLWFALPFWGQAQSDDKTLLSDTSFQLNEVTIGATKTENNKLKIPNQVQIISAREINFVNSPTTAALLEGSGQVFVQKSQMGGGSPVLRGFEANKVLIVMDNVRMNNAIFRGGHLQNVIRVDNAVLDRAEVVFGPGSVVYGSDALGGVLHFRTKSALFSDKKKFNGQFFMRGGTAAGEKTIHFRLNYGSSRFATLTAFTASDFNDLKQGAAANPFDTAAIRIFNRNWYVENTGSTDSIRHNDKPNVQKYSAYAQYNFLQKFKFSPLSGKSVHELNFYFTNTTNVPRYDRLTEYDVVNNVIVPKYAQWYYGPETWAMVSYNFKHNNPNVLWDNITATAAAQYIAESRHSRRFNSVRLKNQYERVHVFSFNFDAAKTIARHSLQYGMEATQNIVNSTADFAFINNPDTSATADTRYPDGGSAMGAYSIYVTDRWELGQRLGLNAGLRYNFTDLVSRFENKDFFPFPFDEAKQHSSAFVGNLGITYNPNTQTKIGLNLSSGYRVPNIDDMGKVFDSGGDILVIPNPDIEPEYTYNAEINTTIAWKNNLKIEGNLYSTYLVDALTRGKTTLNGQDSILYDGAMSAVYTTVNKDKAYILGGFLGLNAQIGKWNVSATANYTYGRIRDEENNSNTPLDHIPPLSGQIRVKYQAQKWRADFWAAFNGQKPLSDYRLNAEDNELYATPNGMPAWFTLNLRGEYYVMPQLVVQLGIENILDTNYRTFASGISAPARNFSGTVRYFFGK